MPNRIIKESICYSDDLDKLSPFEETVFYRLLVRVDDYGRIDARPSFLRSMLFVTKKGITDKNIAEAVAQLASVGLVQVYEVAGKSFLLFPKWSLHQRVRNSREKYPAPTNSSEVNNLAASCGELRPISQSESLSESLSESKRTVGVQSPPTSLLKPEKRFVPPTVDDISAYCKERSNNVDAQRFLDHYASNGWMVGKNRMKDWKAAVRTWERNEFNGNTSPKPLSSRPGKTVADHQYTQRKYTNDELLSKFDDFSEVRNS